MQHAARLELSASIALESSGVNWTSAAALQQTVSHSGRLWSITGITGHARAGLNKKSVFACNFLLISERL